MEVINDINGDLINLYRVLKHHLVEFVNQFKWALTSRQMYEWEKMANPETLTDIQRAARFFYLQKLAFGGKVEGRTFGTATTTPPRLNLLRIEEDLSAAHLRLSRTCIEMLDWETCISKYDREHTLFYIDPPYYGTEGYGVEFGIEQYQHLAEAARTMTGKCLISLNNTPEMRKIFKGLKSRTVRIDYTVGGASSKRKQATELVLKNW